MTNIKKIELEQILPSEIERRSFELIEEELGDRILPADRADIVKRVIHTTADFDYADNLVFSQNAVEEGLEAFRQGSLIVTDTNMGRAGINKIAYEKLGGRVDCFMADLDVAGEASRHGTTRAVASMDKAASLREDCIFAIGNAPTALVRLYELIAQEKIKPRLIIGVPVGFVNVVSSKELILSLTGVPYIVAKGRKGGSNVAAAVCNAFIYRLNR